VAFKFNLDPVLKHRKRLEDAAQKEFADAQNAVAEILRRLENMYQRLDEVRDEISATQQQASAHQVENVREMESFLIGHKRRIDAVRLEARELMRIAEDKQEALIVAARERKVLDKLKEKRMTEHKEWLNRVEQKAADDQTMARQAWQQIRGKHAK